MDPSTNLATIVIERIKEVEGFKKDIDVARALHTESRNISTWRARGTLPMEQIIEYSRERRVSLEWLLNGNGAARSTDMVAEDGGIYRVQTSQDWIYAIAGDVYRATLELGVELPPQKFTQLVRLGHREALDHGSEVPYAKIVELVKLAT